MVNNNNNCDIIICTSNKDKHNINQQVVTSQEYNFNNNDFGVNDSIQSISEGWLLNPGNYHIVVASDSSLVGHMTGRTVSDDYVVAVDQTVALCGPIQVA